MKIHEVKPGTITFSKSHNPENRYDVSDTFFSLQISSESSLDDVLETFEDFLRAGRFVFKGHVAIVDDEERGNE